MSRVCQKPLAKTWLLHSSCGRVHVRAVLRLSYTSQRGEPGSADECCDYTLDHVRARRARPSGGSRSRFTHGTLIRSQAKILRPFQHCDCSSTQVHLHHAAAGIELSRNFFVWLRAVVSLFSAFGQPVPRMQSIDHTVRPSR